MEYKSADGPTLVDRLLRSRRELVDGLQEYRKTQEAAEGGCGVLGLAANLPVAGRHVLEASRQMHNRGNGKGGGIAMAGLDPNQAGVEPDVLRSHTLLQIALLDEPARGEIESQFITPNFEIAQAYQVRQLDDFRQVEGLEGRPPAVWRYFVRVKQQVLDRFGAAHGLEGLPARRLEDEFVYQNSFRLNRQYYASLGHKRAFVLSHGRDLSVLKIVGYAEQVVEYYCLEDQSALVWIAHQRYPTKGRVWHPGGAHPFTGLNEALVHNGDFANYHAVCEYLRQRNIGQLFLTDTEVSVQLFDLWERVYGYPLEVTLEAMAPTSEHDFAMLDPEKQALYRAVQHTHMHGSPDGPWFFILARSYPDEPRYELLGITDTSMLRPQVFALYESGPGYANSGQDRSVQIGLVASERQAINACLRSLSEEDRRFLPVADKYWVARGGSHTDGGSFRFTVAPDQDVTGQSGRMALLCTDKFGAQVPGVKNGRPYDRSRLNLQNASAGFRKEWERQAYHAFDDGGALSVWRWLKPRLAKLSWDEVAWILDWLREFGRQGDGEWRFGLSMQTLLRDRRYDGGHKRRSAMVSLVDNALLDLLGSAPLLAESGDLVSRLTRETRAALQAPPSDGGRTPVLLIDALGFPPEGEQCVARWMVMACQSGWRRLVVYNWRGGRFAACGLGPGTHDIHIDLYGDVGDYAASGLDGAQVHLHGDGQDQLGQILKQGKLVVHGDVGQTFLYGAKGGEIYVLGSAAGRPLINAVGRPRVVINGTCLDYLAESFMAGDPLRGGGFAILNGVGYDEAGRLVELESPYPGGNLFSLASGGAIYLRDPRRKTLPQQLNGGWFATLSEADWDLINPYLEENERLFGIEVDELLSVDGERRAPQEVYRKVQVSQTGEAL